MNVTVSTHQAALVDCMAVICRLSYNSIWVGTSFDLPGTCELNTGKGEDN